MEKVDKHISDLLYEHDCVIVPKLGGFVANYESAKIHPVQHVFLPPSKNIVFNANLKNNDGLLANHIAQAEKIVYPEALKYIDHFVHETNTQLQQGQKVKISDVGKLFLDVEKNIQFKPDENSNHLLDSFGLSQFQSPAIKRDNIGKRIEKEFIDRKPIPAEKRKIKVGRYVALAFILPVAFAMIWIPLKTNWLENTPLANISPFASKEHAKYSPIQYNNATEIKKENFETNTPFPSEGDTAKYKTFKLFDGANSSITAQAYPELVEKVIADSTHVDVNTSLVDNHTGFHIVVGCFQVYENATRFVETLKDENLDAKIIGKNDKGLHVVSCGDYATRNEAERNLASIRKTRTAWLYKN